MHTGFTEKYYDELRFCEELEESYKAQEKLGDAAKMKCYQFIVRLIRMPDLPKSDYYSLLPRMREK